MTDKKRVNPKTLKNALKNIKSRFETGTVTKMDDVGSMYKTGLISAMGIGHDGYVTKFSAPENFTVNDLFKLADITDTDVELIWEVVKRQANKSYKKRDINHLLKDEDPE
jgi:hypothetical protein